MAPGNPIPPFNLDQLPPYEQGVDDLGDNPLGADNARPPDPTDNPANPLLNEAAFRQSLLTVLTEIRDILLSDGEE